MASVSDQFLVQMDLPSHPDEWFDFDNFMDWPSGQIDDHSTLMDSISPPMPDEADAFLGDSPSEFMPPTFSDMTSYDFPEVVADQSAEMGMMLDASPLFDNTEFSHGYTYDNNTDAFRYMVEAHAAADTRVASIKEKRREASIALHLQRLCDATAIDLDMSSESTTSFSSPGWSDFVRDSTSPPSTNSSPDDNAPTPAPTAGNGGVEFVLDLNMNAATNLPKKQKPRSLAQKENYIKARKYGACEKHKKQHKRCNCLEKSAARVSVNESPTDVAFKQTPRTLSLQSSVSPTTRYSSSPGYDPRCSSSVDALPINVVRKSSNSSPRHDSTYSSLEVFSSIRRPTSGVAGHDPSNSTSPVLPSVRATGRHTASIPGHEPTFRPPTTPQTANAENRPKSSGHERSGGSPTALQSVKFTKANLGGQPGHDPSRNSPVASQSVLTTAKSSDTQKLRISHVSRSSGIVHSPEGGFLKPVSSTSTANQPSPGTIFSLKWQASCLTTRSFMKPTNDQIQAIPCGFAGTVGLREPQGFGWCRRAVRGNNSNPSVPQGATQPLVTCAQLACSAKNQVCARSRSTLEQLGGLLSGAIVTLARAWQASSSLSFWVEDAMSRCLSLSGRQLMSARKGLHLSHRRVI